MEVFSAVLLLIVGLLGFVLFRRSRPNSGKMPPGPKGLPVVGNLFDFVKDPPKMCTKWSHEFGDTITVKLGYQKMVVLNDYDKAKAVLTEENVTGRDQTLEFAKVASGHGLLLSEGDNWKDHRRFAISTLRDLGMGKNWFEDAILEEIDQLITVFKCYGGKPFDPTTHGMLAVSNVICALIFGQRFDHSDVHFQKLLSQVGENLQLQVALAPLQCFPLLEYVPFGKLHDAQKQFAGNFNMLRKFIQVLVDERRGKSTKGDESTEAGDYIKRYQEEETKKKVTNSRSTFTDPQLTTSVIDLFMAGAETTSTTLLWAWVYMIENPEIQRKVQEEIENNIGSRPIRMEDKVLLKYTDAVTLEIQRLGSIAPLGLQRVNLVASVIDGYEIPARTPVATNIYGIHRNPRYWSHPHTFYPEHFLDKEGSVKIPKKGFIPFGSGKRECLGENLAKTEIFLFFVNILQHFHIRAAEDLPLPSSEKYFVGITRWPLRYKICFDPRQ